MALGLLEHVNRIGVSVIIALQSTFSGCDDMFHAITELGNSAHSFTLLVPLAAALDLQLACDLLVVCVVGEWCNTLLKGVLLEGRPFWWIRETDIYESLGLDRPELKQTTHTCETGPGSPSGHVMHAAVIGFVLAKWIVAWYDSHSRPDFIRFRNLVWTTYGLLLMWIGVSRMYIAAHFPHQCLLGAALGIPLAWFLTSHTSTICLWWKNASSRQLLQATFVIISISVFAYHLQKALGIDPQWSVKLAFKWCHSHQHIHVSTTNIFSLVRDCGTALGFSIACPHSLRLVNKRLSAPLGLLVALLLNVTIRSVQKSIPTGSVLTFYSAHFLLHASIPLLLLLYFPKPNPRRNPEINNPESSSRSAPTPVTRQSKPKRD